MLWLLKPRSVSRLNHLGIVLFCSCLSPLYPSFFVLQGCWLCKITRITYFCMFIGIFLLAAYL
ncbi:hypothetical protein C9446_05245 [Providencia heimbachae]|nr:hypothetical protein C9446_05245 [Providencia heimbachae]